MKLQHKIDCIAAALIHCCAAFSHAHQKSFAAQHEYTKELVAWILKTDPRAPRDVYDHMHPDRTVQYWDADQVTKDYAALILEVVRIMDELTPEVEEATE